MWHKECDREKIKELKKEFRRVQRRSQFVFEEKKCRNIEKLFEIKKKEEFWKSLDNYKNGKNKELLDEDNKEILINKLKSLFTLDEDAVSKDLEKTRIKEEVKAFEEKARNELVNEDKVYVNFNTIKTIIEELKPKNTKGWDGISNNMVKNIEGNGLIHKIKTLINAILCSGRIPKGLNRSIIVPIIKDKNEKIFNSNNYRPISVSNVIAQILEKVILINCQVFKSISSMQFGFKNAVSTHQPIFLL
jgi:hypothetical protein